MKIVDQGDIYLDKHTFDLYVFADTKWLKIIPMLTYEELVAKVELLEKRNETVNTDKNNENS